MLQQILRIDSAPWRAAVKSEQNMKMIHSLTNFYRIHGLPVPAATISPVLTSFL